MEPILSIDITRVSTGQINVLHNYFITRGGRNCHLPQASGFTTFKVAILKNLAQISQLLPCVSKVKVFRCSRKTFMFLQFIEVQVGCPGHIAA